MGPFASASDQLAALSAGEVNAVELLDAQLERVEAHNGALNAIVWQDVERARATAAAIDGPPTADQPLRGLPMTVKEAYDLAGAPTTWGAPHLRDNVAATDSVVVERLRAAGAVVFGKTNVPFMLADFQSYNDIYGTTNNPWDPKRTPGGSSGGSACALAAGMTALEMGSDIGGSIRNPAHYCGVFGHKPTWSLVPSRGHSPPGGLAEPDIAVCGPLARSAADLDLVLDVVAHPDRLQHGIRYDLPAISGVNGLRVVLWPTDLVAPVSSAVEERVYMVGDALRALGAKVDDTARPEFESADGHRVYGALLQSFLSVSIPDAAFQEARARADELAPDAVGFAADVLRAQTMSHREWLGFHQRRERLRWAWRRFFDEHDIIVMPISATTAFEHDHSPMGERTIAVDGTPQDYFDQIFWAGLAGVAHLPSTVFPTGPADDGLPIGVQLVGPAYGDKITIAVARTLEQEGLAFQPPPRLD